MRHLLRTLMATLLLIGGLGLAALPARADAFDDARAAALVGERADGYAAVVDPAAPADIKQLVNDINAKRRAAYQKIAGEKGVPAEQIGRELARMAIELSQPGIDSVREVVVPTTLQRRGSCRVLNPSHAHKLSLPLPVR